MLLFCLSDDYIHSCSVILPVINSSAKPERPPSLHLNVTLSFGDPTEVCYLGVLASIQQDILRLEVSVDHHVPVAVVYS